MPSHPMAQYLTLILVDTAGFGTFETNLLTIPAYVLFICTVIFFPWLTEKLNERFLLATISQIWVLPCLIALEVLPKSRSPWATYALSVMIFAEPYFHPMMVPITSRNAGSVRTRTVASALYNMHVQVSRPYTLHLAFKYIDDNGIGLKYHLFKCLPDSRRAFLFHWQQGPDSNCMLQHCIVHCYQGILCKNQCVSTYRRFSLQIEADRRAGGEKGNGKACLKRRENITCLQRRIRATSAWTSGSHID